MAANAALAKMGRTHADDFGEDALDDNESMDRFPFPLDEMWWFMPEQTIIPRWRLVV
jgi:hypothetical protein